MWIEEGRRVMAEKWGHRGCDLITGAHRKYEDQWQVPHDWYVLMWRLIGISWRGRWMEFNCFGFSGFSEAIFGNESLQHRGDTDNFFNRFSMNTFTETSTV